jgi:hypothetical protein
MEETSKNNNGHMFRFWHIASGAVYYGYGKLPAEASVELNDILQYRPRETSTPFVKARAKWLVENRVVKPNRAFRFHRGEWVITQLVEDISHKEFHRLLAEFIWLNDHVSLLNQRRPSYAKVIRGVRYV